MRLIAWKVIAAFAAEHPEAEVSLLRFRQLVKAARWQAMDHIQCAAPNVKILNADRVRFEVAGGNFRLIAAVDFQRQIIFVKFLGTHAEYDRIDALTVSMF